MAAIGTEAGARPGALSGGAFALSAFLASRAATLIAAAGIALGTGSSIGRVLSRWDGGWYVSVALYGYPSTVPGGHGDAAQSSLAFFPGYPLLMRAFSSASGLSPELAGLTISFAAGCGATLAIRALAVRLADDETAERVVVLFVFLPAAFVLSMVYAEALFLFLAAGCLVALLDERWLAAGCLATAAGLVRPTAIALVVASAWAAIDSIRRGGTPAALIAPGLASLGSLAFLGYLWVHTGHALAFFEVQSRGWGNRFDLGVSNVRSVLQHLVEGRVTFFVAILAVVAGAVALGLWLLIRWRAPAPVVAYVVVVVALAFMGSNPLSVPRFLLAAFPILVPIARWLTPRATAVLVGASAVAMATLFFVTGTSAVLPP
jgi:hypothetical protein